MPVSSSSPSPAGARREPAVYRTGISAARRELAAGTARRHRGEPVLPPETGSVGGAELAGGGDRRDHLFAAGTEATASAAATAPDGPDRSGGSTLPVPAALATQQAGVRAALAALRQHRGPR